MSTTTRKRDVNAPVNGRRPGIVSEEALWRLKNDPNFVGDIFIPGTKDYVDPEPEWSVKLREDMETRDYYNHQWEKEEEKRKEAARNTPEERARIAALIKEAEAREREAKRLKVKQARGLASTKPLCTPEAADAARERVYEAFLHARQTAGGYEEWDDANRECHALMKKLDYNRSRANQVQDMALAAAPDEFEALQRQYAVLAGRNLGDYWAKLRALRSRFSPRQHAVEAALNEWRQAALAASQVLGIHIIELQNSMPGFAEAHAAELEQRHGVFAPYADESIATG